MAQKISVRIADRTYYFNASSPEEEEVIRQGAESVNKRLSGFLSNYPGKPLTDLLAFVALNEGISRIGVQKELDAWKKAEQSLRRQTDSYLENIEKDSR